MHQRGKPIRGEVRQVGFRRLSHGLFVPDDATLSSDEEWVRDLEAWLLVLPAGAVFTHVTGARLRGWRLPALPENVPVFAAVHGGERRARRPGLLCSRLVVLDKIAGVELRHGLPVENAEDLLLA